MIPPLDMSNPTSSLLILFNSALERMELKWVGGEVGGKEYPKNKTIMAQQALELLVSASVVALILPPWWNCSYFFTATRSEMLFVILTHMSSKGQASNMKPSRGLENSVLLNFRPLRSVVHCSLQQVNKIFVDKQSD